jgi:hypothetical protein
MDRPISVSEAASMLCITNNGIIKSIEAGRLKANQLNGKGWMLSHAQVSGRKFDPAAFDRLCSLYVCVPEACEIMRKTDAAIIRDLRRGRIEGFRLNNRAWAVKKASAEKEFLDYLATMGTRTGRPRLLDESRSPRVLRKRKATT